MDTRQAQPGLSRLQIARAMRWWNVSGALSAGYTAITAGAYATGYALHLGASNAVVGFLAAAPSWGQTLQAISPLLIERLKRRKPLCLAAHATGFSMWIPIALIPFLFSEALRPWAMVALVAVAGATIALGAPAATSWFSDLVPPEARGRFIARQQSVVAAMGLAVSLGAGYYLDAFPSDGKQPAFVSLFIIAVCFALASILAWLRVPEPPRPLARNATAWSLLALPFQNPNFRNLTLFVSARTMSVMIAAPFFVVYMLENLHMPYAQIAAFSALATLSTIVTNPLWGYLGDKYGHKPILRISSFALSLVPFIWFFTTPGNYVFIVPVVQVWAGVMSAGVILSQFSLMVKIAPEENRSIYLGVHSAVVNVAFAVGSVIGGGLAELYSRIGPLELLGHPISSLHCVFLTASLVRLLVLSLIRRIREEHEVAAHVVIERVRSGRPVSTLWSLLRMARSQDPAAKAEAARALGGTRSALVVEELIALLDDSDRNVRHEAARALGEIGDERGAEALAEKIRDPLADIVEEAAEALGKIHGPRSYAALIELLDHPAPSVRQTAALALGNLGDPRARQPLEDLLDRESNSAVFVAAAEAMSKLGSSRALHRLRSLLRNSPPGVGRRELANSIGNLLGPPGEFYRLLEADPMRQEQMVDHALARSYRQLLRWNLLDPNDRAPVREALGEALSHFTWARYAAAISRLRRVAAIATRSLATDARCAELLASQTGSSDAHLDTNAKVHLLLELADSLRLNYGFLAGLDHEAHHRQVSLEEALLGVFSFRRTIEELVHLLRRERPAAQAS